MAAELAASAPRMRGPQSVFRKTVRDSRRALIIVASIIGLLTLIAGAATATAFGTVEARREAEVLALALPAAFQGLLGKPVAMDTLGGIIEWRYPVIFLLLPALWGILALSATLAGEAKAGSLELVVATPLSRRRIAVEKLTGHVSMVLIAVAVMALALWLVGTAFAVLPGDAIALDAAVGYAIKFGIMILLPGALAFALSAFVGRGAAAGLAAIWLFGAYVVNGFQGSIEAFRMLAPLSWYAWTADHLPLARQPEWSALVLPTVAIVAMWAVGVVAFDRRDIAQTVRLRLPSLPSALLGVAGPTSRSFGERLPQAVSWGLGIGVFGLVMASSATTMARVFKDNPVIDQIMRAVFPGSDYATTGGVLQLVFMQLAILVFGLAAATFVGGWASDESSGRLESVLSAPVGRGRWAFGSGVGAFLAVAVMGLLVAAGIAVGAAADAGDAIGPALGIASPILYTLAMVGIGIGVSGLIRPGWGAPVVVVLTFLFFFDETFVPALRWPDWLTELALTTHLGQPMIGRWDATGIALCVAFAVGGLLVGAWGLRRRDLSG
ncbi:MAG: ABC transporter permease subunit [Candidatus Limnocylindrales bacterium]